MFSAVPCLRAAAIRCRPAPQQIAAPAQQPAGSAPPAVEAASQRQRTAGSGRSDAGPGLEAG